MSAPRIACSNAADYPPPSLNAYRTAASRAPADSPPAVWFKQMTGREWDRQSKSYDLEKKRWRRMADGTYIAKEKDRQAELQAQQKRDAEERAEQRREEAPFRHRDELFLFLLRTAGILVRSPPSLHMIRPLFI